MRISPNRREAVEEYIRYLQRELRLEDWTFILKDTPPLSDTAAATTRVRNSSHEAIIWLGDEFLGLKEADENMIPIDDWMRTQTLIHELVHWHLEDMWVFATDVFDAELGSQAKNMARHVYDGHLEIAVDQIAWAFTYKLNTFTLPPDAA